MARAAVIDADGHIVERQSDVRKYLEPPWDRRDTPLLPGGYPWDIELFHKLGYPEYPVGGLPPEEQVAIWLRIMDQENIETAVLFPTGSGAVAHIPEPSFARAVARAANTHFAKEYAARSSRLRPVGVLPLRDPEAAAEELRRGVTELGLVSFELLSAGLPLALGDPVYDPVYAEAERLGVPLCIHGTRARYEEVGGDRFKTFNEIHCYAFPASVLLHFTSVLFNAVPLRFPKLKLAFLEIGATWLPYYLDRMDEHWEMRGEFEAPHLTKKPSALFRESPIFVSVEPDETLLPQTIDFLGDDHFLFASDFPHWDARFPENLEALEKRTDLSPKTKRKILYGNAKVLFGL
jgi:hypothetical protein